MRKYAFLNLAMAFIAVFIVFGLMISGPAEVEVPKLLSGTTYSAS
jgi:hypothetical protein